MKAEEDDNADEKPWDEISFVDRVEGRRETLSRLTEGEARPSTIADDVGIANSTVSHALSELRKRGMVELLTSENITKGRIYGITEEGKRVVKHVEEVGP